MARVLAVIVSCEGAEPADFAASSSLTDLASNVSISAQVNLCGPRGPSMLPYPA